MSLDVFPIQIRVTVYALTRLCANRPIGRGVCGPCLWEVCPETYFRGESEWLSSSWPDCLPIRRLAFPREEVPFSGIIPLPPVIPASPRHSSFSPSFQLLFPSFQLLFPSFLRRQES
jgi:hypothetical protein